MGLVLDENLEEVSFLNNYLLFVKKIVNQLPKLPIYDGQFRGRKDHKSRYTFDQVKRLNESILELEVDIEDLNQFHQKYISLENLQKDLEKVLTDPSCANDFVRDVKRNCERSGVIFDHSAIEYKENSALDEKENVDKFSFWNSAVLDQIRNQEKTDSTMNIVLENSTYLSNLILKWESGTITESELDVAMILFPNVAAEVAEVTKFLNRCKSYYGIRKKIEGLLTCSLVDERDFFDLLLIFIEFKVIPNNVLFEKIAGFLKFYCQIYDQYSSYFGIDRAHNIEIRNDDSLLQSVKQINSSLCDTAETVEYYLQIGINWCSYYPKILFEGSHCYCGLKVEQGPHVVQCSDCRLMFHLECLKLKPRKDYICGICSGNLSNCNFQNEFYYEFFDKEPVIAINCAAIDPWRLVDGQILKDKLFRTITRFEKSLSTIAEDINSNYLKPDSKASGDVIKIRRLIHFTLALPHRSFEWFETFYKAYRKLKPNMTVGPQICGCGKVIKSIFPNYFCWCAYCETIVHENCSDVFGFVQIKDSGYSVCKNCRPKALDDGMIFQGNKKFKIFSTEVIGIETADDMETDSQ
eukprot:NODE_5_length_72347_cov_1.339331.p13 type:complete len:580 gc:universal NODE_5_length_72347_cov_1.339331:15522-13783(-)